MGFRGMTRRGFLQGATLGSATTLAVGYPRGSEGLVYAQTSEPQAQVGQRTTLFYFTVKEGKEQEAQDLLPRMAEVSRAEPGCIAYVIYQTRSNPRDFVLLEQWRDGAIQMHFANLQEVFGPPLPGSPSPLPAVFMDLCNSMRSSGYSLFA